MGRGKTPPDGRGLLTSNKRKQTSVVVIGNDGRAFALAGKIQSGREPDYTLKGFVSDTGTCDGADDGQFPLVGRLDDLEVFLSRNEVDAVLVALPLESLRAYGAHIDAACRTQGIALWLLPDRPLSRSMQKRSRCIGGETVIDLSIPGPGERARLAVKRLADIVGSSILLLVLLPLFLVAALAIKATGRGPVFFIQERVGIRKHVFRMYKFRTMVPDAEERLDELEELNEVQAPAFKIREDPRATPVGRLLRRTSIDELPQLLNVLKGEMSLVGPRPLAIRDYGGIEQDWHRQRFKVRPGITCLWQCNGRSNLSFDHWMALDMEYIDNWSLLLDLKILLRTVPAVLRGSGAA
jgi:exopolysaccharide biosynthesis polyprenyl glycosylphosphotransferase